MQHAFSCKKGGFVTLCHNMIRDVTARLLKEVCHDVRVEPQLLPITGEDLKEATANKSSEARLDISARSVMTGILRRTGVQPISWTVREFKHFKSVRDQ